MTAGADFLQLARGAAPDRGIADWLVNAVQRALVDGRLDVGSRLPATRDLASDLGVSRGVVVAAYERLHEQGLTTARPGVGTVVARRVAGSRSAAAADRADHRGSASPVTPPPNTTDRLPQRLPMAGVEFDLTPGVPDVSQFPRAAWLRHERAVLDTATSADLRYGHPEGHPELRRALAGWLGRTRGVHAEADDVLVVAGVAQSLALLAQVLVRRGTTTIAVEDPGSRGARDQLQYWGVSAVAVPVDDDGLLVDRLRACDETVALLTPAHQYPTGVVLRPHRRRELLDWARGERLVIEDDYDAEHRYDRTPVAALQPAAPEHVAHTGSTSKSLAPGMRLGWLVPPRSLRAELIEAKHANDLGNPAVAQLVLARLLAGGDIDRHLRQVRRRQRQRRDALVTALQHEVPHATVTGVAAGLHLLATFRGGTDDLTLAERARAAGVLVHPLSWHRMTPGPPGLVLGYAAHTPERLADAAARLGRALRSGV